MASCCPGWCPGSSQDNEVSQETNDEPSDQTTSGPNRVNLNEAEQQSIAMLSNTLDNLSYSKKQIGAMKYTLSNLSNGIVLPHMTLPTDQDLATIGKIAPALAFHAKNYQNVLSRAQGGWESRIDYSDGTGDHIAYENRYELERLTAIRASMWDQRRMREYVYERGEPSGTQPSSSGRDWV